MSDVPNYPTVFCTARGQHPRAVPSASDPASGGTITVVCPVCGRTVQLEATAVAAVGSGELDVSYVMTEHKTAEERYGMTWDEWVARLHRAREAADTLSEALADIGTPHSVEVDTQDDEVTVHLSPDSAEIIAAVLEAPRETSPEA